MGLSLSLSLSLCLSVSPSSRVPDCILDASSQSRDVTPDLLASVVY